MKFDNKDVYAASGATLKVYRLALLSDPTFAAYWGAGNVTAGKAILMTRADQIYEDGFSYRLDLVASNDNVNLNTPAQAYEPNGPCGAAESRYFEPAGWFARSMPSSSSRGSSN